MLEDVAITLQTHNLINGDINRGDIIFPFNIALHEQSVKLTGPANIDEIQDYVNGTLKIIELSIREQLSNRDHLLVWCTDGVIVLDPYSVEEKKIHRGVQKELENLRINKLIIVLTSLRNFAQYFSSHLLLVY